MPDPFIVADNLRLEVEADTEGLVNLIPNASGELGGWGWVTPVAGSTLGTSSDGGTRTLKYNGVASTANDFYSETLSIPSGNAYAAASFRVFSGTVPYLRARLEFFDASGALVSQGAQTGYLAVTTGTPYTAAVAATAVPSGAVSVRLRLDFYANTSGAVPASAFNLRFDRVTLATSSTSGALAVTRTNLVTNPSFEVDTTGVAVDGVTVTRTNLLPNPSFETNISGWSKGTGTASIARIPKTKYSQYSGGTGDYMLEIQPTTSGSRSYVNGPTIPVTAGLPYAVSVRILGYTGNAGTGGIMTRFYDDSGAQIGADNINTHAVSATSLTSFGFVYTAPAGATKMRIYPFLNQPGPNGGYVSWLLDSAMVEQAGSVGTYFDGSTADSGDVTYGWTGTANASPSTQTSPGALVAQAAPAAAAPPAGSYALMVATKDRNNPGTVRVTLPSANVTPLTAYAAQVQILPGDFDRDVTMALEWLDSSGAVLAGGTSSTITMTAGTWGLRKVSGSAPAGAAKGRLRLSTTVEASAGMVLYVDAYLIEQGATFGAYFDGATASDATWSYQWSGTANSSTSVALSPHLEYIEPVTYNDILGDSGALTISREDLNVGTLSATVVNPALSPAVADTVRPGRLYRITVYDVATDSFEVLIAGRLANAHVDYYPVNTRPDQQAIITISGTDNVTPLANSVRTQAVGTIDELAWVLEGAGVPWSINGNSDQVASAVAVLTNDNASALDQVALTRDSNLAYAWVDRRGILQAWDRDQISTAVAWGLDESVYNPNIAVAYDTDECINSVSVTRQWTDAETGSSVDGTYGPFDDTDSIRAWGVHSAQFTVAGIAEADVPAFAQSILAANSTPVLRVDSVTIHITSADRLQYALIDLYDLVHVTNAELGLDVTLRVTSVTHAITADPDRPEKAGWLVTLGFASDGAVAAPSAQPPLASTPTDTTQPFGSWVKASDQNVATATEVTVSGWSGTGVGGVSLSGGTITVAKAGTYLVTYAVTFAPTTGTGRRYAALQHNGTVVARGETPGTGGGVQQISTNANGIFTCAAGDTFTLRAFQSSGGTIAVQGDVTTTVSICRLN